MYVLAGKSSSGKDTYTEVGQYIDCRKTGNLVHLGIGAEGRGQLSVALSPSQFDSSASNECLRDQEPEEDPTKFSSAHISNTYTSTTFYT